MPTISPRKRRKVALIYRRERMFIAQTMLHGMLASAPMCDRTKIDKRKWVNVAYAWADELMTQSGLPIFEGDNRRRESCSS